jgi:hypothetical protein
MAKITCVSLLPRDKMNILIESGTVSGVIGIEGMHQGIFDIVREYMQDAVGTSTEPVTCVVSEITGDLEFSLLSLDKRDSAVILEINIDDAMVITAKLDSLFELSSLLSSGKYNTAEIKDMVIRVLEEGGEPGLGNTISFVPFIKKNTIKQILLLDNTYKVTGLNIDGIRVGKADRLMGIINYDTTT